MKTTVELPDQLLRDAKATAAKHGLSLKDWLTDAVQAKLSTAQALSHSKGEAADPPWMEGFGALNHLKEENRRIETIIEAEFEEIEPEDIP